SGIDEGTAPANEVIAQVPLRTHGSALPDPEVLGFAQSGEVVSGAWQADLHMNLLSTVAYFGINFWANGSLVTTDSGYQGYFSTQESLMTNTAHANGARVIVVVKSFDNNTVQIVTGSETTRQRLIANIVSLIRSRNADGVNLDFEAYATP